MDLVLDNSALIRNFIPETFDGDTFLYTEMLDRSKDKGNNSHRLVQTFYHRSRDEFDEQMPTIRTLCDLTSTRAYTRLAPRSFRKVSHAFVRLVMDAALTDNHAGQKSMYNRALGTVTPNEKLWLFDVDAKTQMTEGLANRLKEDGYLKERIPSRKGEHLITIPFDSRDYIGNHGWGLFGDVQLHKDNPTNLYIPDGAA